MKRASRFEVQGSRSESNRNEPTSWSLGAVAARTGRAGWKLFRSIVTTPVSKRELALALQQAVNVIEYVDMTPAELDTTSPDRIHVITVLARAKTEGLL